MASNLAKGLYLMLTIGLSYATLLLVRHSGYGAGFALATCVPFGYAGCLIINNLTQHQNTINGARLWAVFFLLITLSFAAWLWGSGPGRKPAIQFIAWFFCLAMIPAPFLIARMFKRWKTNLQQSGGALGTISDHHAVI